MKRVVFSCGKNRQNGTSLFVKLLLCVCFSIIGVLSGFYFSFNCGLECCADAKFAEESIECSVGANKVISSDLPRLKDIIRDFFKAPNSGQKDNRILYVYPGGYPLGFTLECEGVIIVAIGSVNAENTTEKPADGKNIKVGDILYSINGEVIKNATHLHELINPEDGGGQEVNIVLKRDKQLIEEKITPIKEVGSQMYRLGLWIRDNAAGVGTLTYVRQDNQRFGALGHPVCDIDTGKVMPIAGGSIYKCNIVGFNKGARGNPGELRGLFLRNGIRAGTLDNNNEYGVYGTMDNEYIQNMQREPIQVGFRDSVKTGKAKILCTIDGNSPEEYSIEIVKLSYQAKSDKKSMVIKVTDSRLINETGGIVQGMSGSPIIQDGKLVGAVTHVFVSDPTKGFGVYIDWMIDN